MHLIILDSLTKMLAVESFYGRIYLKWCLCAFTLRAHCLIYFPTKQYSLFKGLSFFVVDSVATVQLQSGQ